MHAQRVIQVVFLVLCASVVGWGTRKLIRHLRRTPTVHAAALPAEKVEAKATVAGHPRLILDAKALAASAKADTPAWQRVHRLCDAQLAAAIPSGYQSFDWADAVADLSLCWHATGDKRYATGALRYLGALLDDRDQVGDGKGGDEIVRRDQGYGIRTFGVYAALGYDWLHDAPGMTGALRAKIVARLDAWLAWYAKSGYLHDTAISNYFVGYLTAITFAGLATDGEAKQGAAWLATARDDLLGKLELPALRAHEAGGDWSEGWQYGELVAAQLALIVVAYRTATGVDLAPQIPWFAEVVTHHVHALQPGGNVYDGGTWSEWPAASSAIAMIALPLVLDGHDDARAAQARWLTRHALTMGDERAWVALLADRPGAADEDPRASEPLGWHAAGTGLSLMRGAWSRDAVYVSLQLGPRRAIDHQHEDQGHFEVWRGADALLVDGGPDEGDATINHNTLLVDDGKQIENYSPNQGVWGFAVPASDFGDDGRVAVARGDFAEAYAPSCVEDGCTKRSVEQAQRTLVFVRPSLVVVEDRVRVADAKHGVRWLAHVPVAPAVDDGALHASAVNGGSRVDVYSLGGGTLAVVKEPTGSFDDVYEANHPHGAMWRLETTTDRGAKDRRLLHWITTDDAGAKPAAPTVAKNVASGVSGGRRVAVIFADAGAKEVHAQLPRQTALVVVVGLARDAHVTSKLAGCEFRVTPDDAGAIITTPAGFVSLETPDCGASR